MHKGDGMAFIRVPPSNDPIQSTDQPNLKLTSPKGVLRREDYSIAVSMSYCRAAAAAAACCGGPLARLFIRTPWDPMGPVAGFFYARISRRVGFPLYIVEKKLQSEYDIYEKKRKM